MIYVHRSDELVGRHFFQASINKIVYSVANS